MNIEELKQRIEQDTGVPASLLNGETAEENIAKAKALLAYKREHEVQKPQSNREAFSDWFRAQEGEVVQDPAGAALAQIENELRSVPVLRDAGEVAHNAAAGTAKEQFAQWLYDKTAWNPRQSADGWKPLF